MAKGAANARAASRRETHFIWVFLDLGLRKTLGVAEGSHHCLEPDLLEVAGDAWMNAIR